MLYFVAGYDLIEWLMERLSIEESEALNIGNQLCLHGYFFPVSDSKTLVVKDDSSLYRFQTPYYWPWQHKTPDNVEYAIYLVKRSLRNKQRHGLEDYEVDALASLHKNLKAKWDFITMQAEEQVKLSKDRKKGDKIVADSQVKHPILLLRILLGKEKFITIQIFANSSYINRNEHFGGFIGRLRVNLHHLNHVQCHHVTVKANHVDGLRKMCNEKWNI